MESIRLENTERRVKKGNPPLLWTSKGKCFYKYAKNKFFQNFGKTQNFRYL